MRKEVLEGNVKIQIRYFWVNFNLFLTNVNLSWEQMNVILYSMRLSHILIHPLIPVCKKIIYKVCT